MSWLTGDVTHGPGVTNSAGSVTSNGSGGNGSISSPSDVVREAAQNAQDVYEMQSEENEVNRSWTAEQNRLNREFQQYNSDTQYQRAVKDLIAAGLNPVLAAKIGGASTPSGSSMSPSYSSAASSAGNIFASMFSSGMSLLSTMMNNESQERQTEAKIESQEKQTEWKINTQMSIAQLNANTKLTATKLGIDADKWNAGFKSVTDQELKKLEYKLKDEFETNHPSNAWEAIWPSVNQFLQGLLDYDDITVGEAMKQTGNFINLSFIGAKNFITPTTLKEITEAFSQAPIETCISTWKEVLKTGDNKNAMDRYKAAMKAKGYEENLR